MTKYLFRGKATKLAMENPDLQGHIQDGWVYGNLIWNNGDPWIVGDIADWDDEYIAHEWWVNVIPETVGQYAGIDTTDDKTKLFEGDDVTILEIFADGRVNDCHSGVICFRNGQFLIDEIPMSEYVEEYDIILSGNIHDHLELADD